MREAGSRGQQTPSVEGRDRGHASRSDNTSQLDITISVFSNDAHLVQEPCRGCCSQSGRSRCDLAGRRSHSPRGRNLTQHCILESNVYVDMKIENIPYKRSTVCVLCVYNKPPRDVRSEMKKKYLVDII